MRNSAKLVFFLVLVAFAGFMILQGLISIFSDPTQTGGGAPPQGIIGSVNGQEITVRQFENIYRPRAQALYQEEEEPSEEELQKIRDEVWNQLTTVTNLYQEAAKHDIRITDAEVAEYMKLTPPQDLMTLPDFQTGGQFDLAKYQSWLRQMAGTNNPDMMNFLSNFEAQIRQQIMVSRLQNLVASMVRVTPAEAQDDFIAKNEKVKVRYILIPQSEFSSEEVEIPESDVLARYNRDKESYKKPEQAVVSYVIFPRMPSEDDYSEVKGLVDSLYRRAIAGDDFAKLAEEFSEDPGSGKKGGDLGWFGEGAMVEPFWNATLALKNIGDISSPVKTQFGWHIIKLTGRQEADSPADPSSTPEKKTQYRASHILIKVEISNATLADIQSRAENFILNAGDNGFEASAEDFGLPVTQTDPFTKSGFIPDLGPAQDLGDFPFNAKPGDISEVISHRIGFIIIRLDQIIPESFTPLEEVKERIVQNLQKEKRVDIAYERATGLVGQISGGKSLDLVADESERTVMEPDYFARHEFVKNVGNDAAFIGAAFGLAREGRKIGAVKSTSGAYILELVDLQPADTTMFTAKADSLTQELSTSRRQEAWNKWIGGLMQGADIKDYRSFYYGT